MTLFGSDEISDVVFKRTKATSSHLRKQSGSKNCTLDGKPTKDSRKRAPFPLFKLPVEIRNRIYQFALVDAERSISIEIKQGTPQRRLMSPNDYCSYQKAKEVLGLPVWNLSCDTRQPILDRLNCPINTGLLLVCKQINREATKFLYSENCFLFLDTRAMDIFLDRIQRHVPHLQYVSIAWFKHEAPIRHQNDAFRRLIEAKNLRALVLERGCLESLHRKRADPGSHEAAASFYAAASSWLWTNVGRKGSVESLRDLIFLRASADEEARLKSLARPKSLSNVVQPQHFSTHYRRHPSFQKGKDYGERFWNHLLGFMRPS